MADPLVFSAFDISPIPEPASGASLMRLAAPLCWAYRAWRQAIGAHRGGCRSLAAFEVEAGREVAPSPALEVFHRFAMLPQAPVRGAS